MSLLARAAPRVRRPAGAWPRVCAELFGIDPPSHSTAGPACRPPR